MSLSQIIEDFRRYLDSLVALLWAFYGRGAVGAVDIAGRMVGFAKYSRLRSK